MNGVVGAVAGNGGQDPAKPRQRRLVSVSYLARVLNVSERTVWRMEADGKMPGAIRLAPKITRWDSGDIDSWIESKRKAAK